MAGEAEISEEEPLTVGLAFSDLSEEQLQSIFETDDLDERIRWVLLGLHSHFMK